MTTAVLRIAKASVGHGAGIRRPRWGAWSSHRTSPQKSLSLIERERVTTAPNRSVSLLLAVLVAACAREDGSPHFSSARWHGRRRFLILRK